MRNSILHDGVSLGAGALLALGIIQLLERADQYAGMWFYPLLITGLIASIPLSFLLATWILVYFTRDIS